MNKIKLALIAITGLLICNAGNAQENNFGKKIDEKGTISMPELMNQLKDKESMETKVTGKISEVCQEMGCWMTIDKGDGTTMRVRMKGHSFFVPKDCAGKTAVIEGTVKSKKVSVEQLKHYAEDAGKSAEEIASITEPKVELTFEAEGVLLKD